MRGAQEQEENEVKELEQRLQAQLAHARQASAERKQRQEEAQQEQAAQRKKARLRRQVQALRTRLLAQVAHLELAQKAAAAGLASGAVPSQAHGADQSLLQPQHQHQLPKQQHEQQLQAQIQRLQHTLGDREEALQKRLQNHRAAALSPSPHSPSAAAAAPQAAPVSSNKAAAAAAALRQADERVKRETHVLHTLEQQAEAAKQRAVTMSRRAAAEARLLSRSKQLERQEQQAGAAQGLVANGSYGVLDAGHAPVIAPVIAPARPRAPVAGQVSIHSLTPRLLTLALSHPVYSFSRILSTLGGPIFCSDAFAIWWYDVCDLLALLRDRQGT